MTWTQFANLSGSGLVAAWVTGTLLLCGAVWCLVTIGGKLPGWWRAAWSRVVRWHVRTILRDGPIHFDQRDQGGAAFPIVLSVIFAVLVGAIWWRCGR